MVNKQLRELYERVVTRTESVVALDKWEQTPDEYARNLDELKKFIQHINKFAWQPIDFDGSPKTWLSERVEEQQNNPIWTHLSTDTTSQKYFHKSPMDATEGIFMVDIDFLIQRKGNSTDSSISVDKKDGIRTAIKAGNKLDTPQYWLRDNNLGEGNHRVAIMKSLGMKSVPVRIYWKG